MNKLENIVKSLDLSDRIFFENYIDGTINRLNNLKQSEPCSVLVVSDEKNYLAFGKVLRDKICENNFSCDALVVGELPSSEALTGYNVVIGFNVSLTKSLAIYSKKLGFNLYFVATDFNYFTIFDQNYTQNYFNKIDGNIDGYILDLQIFKNSKRNDLADAYSLISGVALNYYIVKWGEQVDGMANENQVVNESVLSALSALKSITFENAVGVLIIASLYLIKAVNLMPSILSSGVILPAKILSSLSKTSQNECVFGLIGPLLTLIKGYIEFNFKLTFAQIDPIKDVDRLSEIINLKSLTIYQNLVIYNNEQIKAKRQNLVNADIAIESLMHLVVMVKNNYQLVYKGRHNRANFTGEEIKTSLKLGGMMETGLLKLMYGDGFLSIITEV